MRRMRNYVLLGLISAGIAIGADRAFAQQVIQAGDADMDVQGRMSVAVEQAVALKKDSVLLLSGSKIEEFSNLIKAKPHVLQAATRRGVKIFACEHPYAQAEGLNQAVVLVELVRSEDGEPLRYKPPKHPLSLEITKLCRRTFAN